MRTQKIGHSLTGNSAPGGRGPSGVRRGSQTAAGRLRLARNQRSPLYGYASVRRVDALGFVQIGTPPLRWSGAHVWAIGEARGRLGRGVLRRQVRRLVVIRLALRFARKGGRPERREDARRSSKGGLRGSGRSPALRHVRAVQRPWSGRSALLVQSRRVVDLRSGFRGPWRSERLVDVRLADRRSWSRRGPSRQRPGPSRRRRAP
jgi:hypothetical protein